MNIIWSAAYDLLQNPMAFVLMIMAILAIIILWVIQARNDNFDLRFLFTDERTHQPSVHKLGELVALIVSTWMIVYLALTGHMNENYFGMYMAVWAAAQVANKWVGNKSPLVNTSTSSTLVTQTTVQPTLVAGEQPLPDASTPIDPATPQATGNQNTNP